MSDFSKKFETRTTLGQDFKAEVYRDGSVFVELNGEHSALSTTDRVKLAEMLLDPPKAPQVIPGGYRVGQIVTGTSPITQSPFVARVVRDLTNEKVGRVGLEYILWRGEPSKTAGSQPPALLTPIPGVKAA